MKSGCSEYFTFIAVDGSSHVKYEVLDTYDDYNPALFQSLSLIVMVRATHLVCHIWNS